MAILVRLGLQKDVQDNRADCFLHLIQSVLPDIKQKPRFLLIENVKGFETSEARRIMMQILNQLKYDCRELLLSPSQIGIPNSRLRYYLIARLSPDFAFESGNSVIQTIPSIQAHGACRQCCSILFPNSDLHPEANGSFKPEFETQSLQIFLQGEGDVLPHFSLNDKQLRYTQVLDIVTRCSDNTCCFTRGYGHLLQGSGSVLQTNESRDPHETMLQISQLNESERLVRLRELGLRFFTPHEIANLMTFPADFTFPDHVTDQQKYRLLGNSVNVQMICLMLKLLLLT